MPIRDIALTTFFFGLLPFVFRHPDWGILMWTWIGLMNPHRLTWDFAYKFPFASIVGAVTIVALLAHKELRKVPWHPPVVVLALFIVWMTVSTIFAFYPDMAWDQWHKILKIQLFIFLTLMSMQERNRVIALVWVSTLSLGFFGFKGGIYTLTSGGSGSVVGPDGGFIAGNTEISLALTMTIPLMRWLQLQAEKPWIRYGLGIGMALSAIAILGSYSRGGLLAIIGMGGFLWLKSRNKAAFTVLLIPLAIVALVAMPDRWWDRMATIAEYQQDSSAMGRINAWTFAFNLAKDHPLTGGGFWTFDRAAFAIWAPNPLDVHHAHSIWFQVLGEHGFVGLALFLLLWWYTWRSASSIITRTHGKAPLQWSNDLAKMIQVSLIGYWVGGSFLGLANWDYPYLLMVILVLTRVVVDRELAQPVPQATPVRPPSPAIAHGVPARPHATGP